MKSTLLAHWDEILHIASEKQAVGMIRRVAIGLYVLALLNIITATSTGDVINAFDSWVLFTVGVTIQHCHSRIAAFFIIPYCFWSISSSIYCQYYHLPDGRSIILSTIAIILSMNAIIATQGYHRVLKSRINWKNAILKTTQAILYALLALMITVFGIVLPYFESIVNAGGWSLVFLLCTILPTVGSFLAFNGWLPFTHDEPACFYGVQPSC